MKWLFVLITACTLISCTIPRVVSVKVIIKTKPATHKLIKGNLSVYSHFGHQQLSDSSNNKH